MIPYACTAADVRSPGFDSLCSPRAAPAHRPRPARAPPRGARGEPRAPSRAARRGAGGGRRAGRVPRARADRATCSRTSPPRSRCASTTRAWRRSRAATHGLSAVVSFVEESGDHRLFIAAALLEDGEIRHVHRKVFLPTYGLFDERRFFAAGDLLRAVPSRLGRGRRHRGVRGLLAPADAAAARARRRPDADQRVVVAGPRPRGDERGRPRDGDARGGRSCGRTPS